MRQALGGGTPLQAYEARGNLLGPGVLYVPASARARLLAAIDEDDETSAEALVGMISRAGRVLAWRLATGERIIYEGEIQVGHDGALVRGWSR